MEDDMTEDAALATRPLESTHHFNTVYAEPGSKPSLLANLNGRLPSTPDEILEAIRQGEEDIKAGRTVPVEEMIAELERIVAEEA
jgi:hypothetical protein